MFYTEENLEDVQSVNLTRATSTEENAGVAAITLATHFAEV